MDVFDSCGEVETGPGAISYSIMVLPLLRMSCDYSYFPPLIVFADLYNILIAPVYGLSN